MNSIKLEQLDDSLDASEAGEFLASRKRVASVLTQWQLSRIWASGAFIFLKIVEDLRELWFMWMTSTDIYI